MPKVDFYILNEPSLEACYSFICRLLNKAYQQQHQVYVHTATEIEARALDDLLWIFRDDAFIPHALLNEISAPFPPIIIGYQQAPKDHHDILINVSAEIPAFFTEFQRVIEIVANGPQAKKISREKFRHYREAKCELTTHDLSKA